MAEPGLKSTGPPTFSRRSARPTYASGVTSRRGARRWPHWRSRLGGVRLRSALSAAAVVTAAAAIVTVGLIFAARDTLTGNVDANAQQRSDEVVAAIRAGDSTRLAEALRASPAEQALVQVLDPSGQVVAASAVIAGRPALTGQRPQPGETVWEQRSLPLRVEDPFRIVTTAVDTGGSTRIVVVAQSMARVNESTEVITGAAAVAMPLLAGDRRRWPRSYSSAAHCGRSRRSAAGSPPSPAVTCTPGCPYRRSRTRSRRWPRR